MRCLIQPAVEVSSQQSEFDGAPDWNCAPGAEPPALQVASASLALFWFCTIDRPESVPDVGLNSGAWLAARGSAITAPMIDACTIAMTKRPMPRMMTSLVIVSI